jgi:serine/threonine-protein kinase
MSADAENEYFCDGLAEELLNALSKIEKLRVAARTSAFSFKGKEVDIRDVGQKLNVSSVLEGSVRKAGNRLRVSAQLINVADGYHLWSERYDRELEDIFEIQDEISLAIVDALKVRLLGDQEDAVLKRQTDNADAYQLYLKGRYHYNKWTEEGFKKAIEYYRQAVSLDPGYAAAYAEKANSYGTLLYFGHIAPNETLPMMSAAVEKALRLDDTSVEAHLTLAKIKFYYEWDLPGAERELKRAIELNPSHAEARLFYAFHMDAIGSFEEAVAEAKRAIELDPLCLITNLLAGFVFSLAGHSELAAQQSRKLLDLEPNFHGAYLLSGIAHALDGRYEEAIEPCKKALSLGGGCGQLGFLGYVYGASGRRGDALETIEQIEEIRKQRYVPAYYTAIVYAGLGEADEMLKWLEKAYEERNGPLATLNRDNPFRPYHSDPRFQDLLRRIGLS